MQLTENHYQILMKVFIVDTRAVDAFKPHQQSTVISFYQDWMGLVLFQHCQNYIGIKFHYLSKQILNSLLSMNSNRFTDCLQPTRDKDKDIVQLRYNVTKFT